jgi:hypothetical protein
MTRTSWFLLALILITPGCSALDHDFSLFDESAPTGKPNHLGVIWKDGLDVQLDPNQGGRPVPGFAGRLIFMKNKPNKPGGTVAVDGTVTIELYDDSNPHAPPIARETWTIQPDHLTNLISKDTTGWGYPLWIPWNTFDPTIRSIRLITRYTGKDGGNLISEPNIIKIPDTRRGGLPPPQLSVMTTSGPQWMK